MGDTFSVNHHNLNSTFNVMSSSPIRSRSRGSRNSRSRTRSRSTDRRREKKKQRVNGKVVGIQWDKGYGFLEIEGKDEIFFNTNDLQGGIDIRQLREGDKVTCTIGPPEHSKGHRDKARDIIVEDLESVRDRPERGFRPSSRRRRRSGSRDRRSRRERSRDRRGYRSRSRDRGR